MYKKTWTKKYGKSEIFTFENSHCKNVEVDMVRLSDGETAKTTRNLHFSFCAASALLQVKTSVIKTLAKE